jgi:hypothetical protein
LPLGCGGKIDGFGGIDDLGGGGHALLELCVDGRILGIDAHRDQGGFDVAGGAFKHLAATLLCGAIGGSAGRRGLQVAAVGKDGSGLVAVGELAHLGGEVAGGGGGPGNTPEGRVFDDAARGDGLVHAIDVVELDGCPINGGGEGVGHFG